jgi:ABC-type phosphate/phosphonate transport system substrate-binding protein
MREVTANRSSYGACAINRSSILLTCLILLALLPACRRLGDTSPTLQPTLTPTPRSTPLPVVPTAIPPGTAENPLRLVFVARDTARAPQAIQNAIAELESALETDTGLSLTVDRVATDAEALTALCDSVTGTMAAAWLNAVGYLAAEAQDCGVSALQVERARGETRERIVLLVNRDSGIEDPAGLDGASFCRLSATDLPTWFIPSLMLQASGVETAALSSVNDFEDSATLINALAEGDCDAVGITQAELQTVSNADVRAALLTLQSVELPFAILALPQDLPLGTRTALADALVSIGNGSRAALLEPLLDHEAIVPVQEGDLDALRELIRRAGIDLAQMGS